jgi:hypothetical protein
MRRIQIVMLLLMSKAVYAQTYPENLIPENLYTINIGLGASENGYDKWVKYLSGNFVIGTYMKNNPPGIGSPHGESGSFVYNSGTTTKYAGESFIGIDQGKLYGSNSYINLGNNVQTALSLQNAPQNITYFWLGAVSGNRVLGTYESNERISDTMIMPTQSRFKGIINSDNTISYTTLEQESGGRTELNDISGNIAYGSYTDYSNNTKKGLLYNLDNGERTYFEVPNAGSTELTRASGNNLLGMYGVATGQTNPVGGSVYEYRTFIYDGTNINTIVMDNPQNPINPFAYIGVTDIDGDKILFNYTGTGGANHYIGSVPEPSALSLCAVGLSGWAMMRRRRS